MEKLSPDYISHEWVLDKGECSLLGFFGDDNMIADTARVSYRKGTKQNSTDDQLIRYLMRNKHTGPFEHVSVRLYLKAPLFVIQQLLRHRTFKFNQASARYSEMLNESYIPLLEHITTQDAKNKQSRTNITLANDSDMQDLISTGAEVAFCDYNTMLQNGVARELARINIPHGTYSEIIVTADLHNLLHFLKLRLDPHAQMEIRAYAEPIYQFVKGLFPSTIKAWEDCVLNSFTLTVQMQDTFCNMLTTLAYGNLDCSNDKELFETIDNEIERTSWPSKSEKKQFRDWLVNKLRV